MSDEDIRELRLRLGGVEAAAKKAEVGLVRMEGKLDRHDEKIAELGGSVRTIKERLFDRGGLAEKVTELVSGQRLAVKVVAALGSAILAVLSGLVIWAFTRG